MVERSGNEVFKFAPCRDCCGRQAIIQCGYFFDGFQRDAIGSDWTIDAGSWNIAATGGLQKHLQTAHDNAIITPTTTPNTANLGTVVEVSLRVLSTGRIGDQWRVYLNYGAAGGQWYLQVTRGGSDPNEDPQWLLEIYKDAALQSSLEVGHSRVAGVRVCMSTLRIASIYFTAGRAFSGPSANTTDLVNQEVALGSGNTPGIVAFDNVEVSHHTSVVGIEGLCGTCHDCALCDTITPDTLLVTLPPLTESPNHGCGQCAQYAGQYILHRLERPRFGITPPWSGRSCFWSHRLQTPRPCDQGGGLITHLTAQRFLNSVVVELGSEFCNNCLHVWSALEVLGDTVPPCSAFGTPFNVISRGFSGFNFNPYGCNDPFDGGRILADDAIVQSL